MTTKLEYCQSCGQWFQPRENDGHIVVKVRGYKPRYYCGSCMIQNNLLKRGQTNEHK